MALECLLLPLQLQSPPVQAIAMIAARPIDSINGCLPSSSRLQSSISARVRVTSRGADAMQLAACTSRETLGQALIGRVSILLRPSTTSRLLSTFSLDVLSSVSISSLLPFV